MNKYILQIRMGIQWNPAIKDTIGDLHFVHYGGVSLTEGLYVIHFLIINIIYARMHMMAQEKNH